MIDIAGLDTHPRRRKCRATSKALSLDQESREFLAERSDGAIPLFDAFYGQFLDPLPPVKLKHLLRQTHVA